MSPRALIRCPAALRTFDAAVLFVLGCLVLVSPANGQQLPSEEKPDEPPFLVGGKRLTERGIDHAEFYFSPNPGEPVKPLAKIASGGELSRLMLALKALVIAPGVVSMASAR